MPDNIKPSNSHIALANVGDEFKIIRDNMPFGNISTNEMALILSRMPANSLQ